MTMVVGTKVEFQKFLGYGSYGTVSLYKSSRLHDGKPHYLAAKTSDDKHADSLHREFQILSEFRGCSRIVQSYGIKVQQKLNKQGYVNHKFFMEYASEGSLRNFTKRFKDMILPESLIRSFTRMILEGLATIHQHGYVHCDLKPENILVFPRFDQTYQVKISDFGLCERDGDSSWWSPSRPYAGTESYMSPEAISHGETTKGLDLWSLGCVVVEMYTGIKPWWDKNYDLICLMNRYEPLIPNDLPCDAKQFLLTCFAPETQDRTDALTLLTHSFLRQEEDYEY